MHGGAKRLLWGCGALVLVVGLAALLHSFSEPIRRTPPLSLATGETFILQGITYGTNHPAPGSSRWLRLLPAALRQRLEPRFGKALPFASDRATSDPKLLLWLEVRMPAPANAGSGVQTWLMLADEQGRVAGARESLYRFSGQTDYCHVVEFRAFPRRSRQLQVWWLQGTWDKAAVVGQWRIPNPALASGPSWSPESLPATRRDGDLECSISDLVTGLGNSSGVGSSGGGRKAEYEPAKAGAEVSTAMPVCFRERGLATNTWEMGKLTLCDSGGNRVEATSWSSSVLDNTLMLRWSPALWPAETWELEFSAKRNAEATYQPGELVVFKDISLGEENVAVPLQDQKQLQGITIALTQFTRRKPQDSNWGSSSQASELKYTVRGLTNDVYVDLIKATDDTGKTHKSGSSSRGGSGSGAYEGSYNFSDIPLKARSLSFTFAVQHGRSFTFRLQPLVATNKVSLPSK